MGHSKKRKNKNLNVSGESKQKVQVSTSQPPIPRIQSNMEPVLNNSGGNNSGYIQHSSPSTSFQGNQFSPYMPQGPQSQFAGFVSPINQQSQQMHQNQIPNVQGGSINETLSIVCAKLDQMSTKLSKLEIIDKRLDDLEKNVSTVNKEIQGVKEIKMKVVEIEKGMSYLSSQYDNQQKEIREIKHTIGEINKRPDNHSVMAELQEVRDDLTQLKESHLDLQTRSMRDNLLFEGIPEDSEENTEEVIKDFIQTELEITDEINFHRVHRMGKHKENKHRPIVAKFVLHKDKEIVRRAAPEKLKNCLVLKDIPGSPWESTVNVVKDYLREELKISEDIQLNRAHRVKFKQARSESDSHHQEITVQFAHPRDKERIKRTAPGKTSEISYGINEQFPREINERRKQLYPMYKEAKRQGKRATIIVDKLFVEGSRITPNHKSKPELEPMETNRNTQLKSNKQNPNKSGRSAAPQRATPQERRNAILR